MAYTTPSCMHMALLQLQALISIGLLLASMSSGSAEEAPSGYGIELIHVDANGGFTREDQLIHRVVDRSADMLSATDGDDTPASSSSGTDSVAAVVHGRHLEWYLMKLEIGTAPEASHSLVVLDTGSDLVWTTQLCEHSASFTPVNCSDPDNRVTCNRCVFGLCMLNRTFGSGMKTATGFIGNQTLTLSTTEYNNVSIACAIDNVEELMPESAQGIVGLNRGNMSLVQQLNLTHFSHCLSDKQSTRLWLGDGYDVLAKLGKEYPDIKLQTTPLVHVEGIEDTSVLANMYYVQLEGISIGGNVKYRHLPESSFKLRTKENKGVMMLDSGHSRTKLEKGVFEALEELLTEELAAEKTKNRRRSCFRRPTDRTSYSKRPEMVLYFKGGEMHLPWANYTDEVTADKFCLTIHKGEMSILGTFHQVNTYMLYDLTKWHEELSFLPGIDCHKA